MSRQLCPTDSVRNDVVMTPRPLAAAIIAHFKPTGLILDPCCGDGAFYDQFPSEGASISSCEIGSGGGTDFLKPSHVDMFKPFKWCISNPPWSKIRAFNRRAMEVADNIVWLCTINHFWTKARLRDMDQAGFAMKEILLVDTPSKETGWPQSGFQCGAVHIQRGYKGPIKISR